MMHLKQLRLTLLTGSKVKFLFACVLLSLKHFTFSEILSIIVNKSLTKMKILGEVLFIINKYNRILRIVKQTVISVINPN